MKLKVGQKVTIDDWFRVDQWVDGIRYGHSSDQRGQTVTVAQVIDNKVFKINEDNHLYSVGMIRR